MREEGKGSGRDNEGERGGRENKEGKRGRSYPPEMSIKHMFNLSPCLWESLIFIHQIVNQVGNRNSYNVTGFP